MKVVIPHRGYRSAGVPQHKRKEEQDVHPCRDRGDNPIPKTGLPSDRFQKYVQTRDPQKPKRPAEA